MNDPGVMQALLERKIDPTSVYFNNKGKGNIQETFGDTTLNFYNKKEMAKKNGGRTSRIYQAVKHPALFGKITFVHDGVPGANDGTQHEGWYMIRFDPKNPIHGLIAGKFGNFYELLAAMAKFNDAREMMSELKPSHGWILSPDTPRKRGRPAQGEVSNMHRAVCFHMEGCNFFNGGPDKFGGNSAAAKYHREWRAKKGSEKKRKAPDSKPAASVRTTRSKS